MLLAFALLAVLILVGAIWVVTLRNLFRAPLSLGLVLLGVAGLFLLLEAEFLAFAQILVYVRAVLTLIIFAVMLTAKLQGSAAPASRQQIPAAAVSVGLFAALASATQPLVWPAAGSSGAGGPVAPRPPPRPAPPPRLWGACRSCSSRRRWGRSRWPHPVSPRTVNTDPTTCAGSASGGAPLMTAI